MAFPKMIRLGEGNLKDPMSYLPRYRFIDLVQYLLRIERSHASRWMKRDMLDEIENHADDVIRSLPPKKFAILIKLIDRVETLFGMGSTTHIEKLIMRYKRRKSIPDTVLLSLYSYLSKSTAWYVRRYALRELHLRSSEANPENPLTR